MIAIIFPSYYQTGYGERLGLGLDLFEGTEPFFSGSDWLVDICKRKGPDYLVLLNWMTIPI